MKKKAYVKFLLIGILLFITAIIQAQGQRNTSYTPDTALFKSSILNNPYQGQYFYLDSANQEFIYIPRFEQILDSARIYSPVLYMSEAEIEKQREIKNSEDRIFLKNIGVFGNANYGNQYFTNDRTFSDGQITPIYPLTLNSQRTNWVVGVWARFSIQDIIGYNRIAISQQNLIKAETDRWKKERELREIVMIRYNNLLRSIAVYQTYADNQKSINIIGKLMEEEYINGEIKTREYMAYIEIKSRSNSNAERAKADVRIAYLVLQEIAGVQLSSLRSNK